MIRGLFIKYKSNDTAYIENKSQFYLKNQPLKLNHTYNVE